MYRLHFAPLLTHPWAFRLFLSLAFMNKAAMNMGVYVSESVSSSLGVHTKKFCLSFKGKKSPSLVKTRGNKGNISSKACSAPFLPVL